MKPRKSNPDAGIPPKQVEQISGAKEREKKRKRKE